MAMAHRSISLLKLPDSSATTALVILNYSLPNWTPLLWSKSQLRICADGGANRLYREIGTLENGRWRESLVPDYIIGDLDSIEASVKDFYSSKGTEIVDRSSDQDTTDLHKCVSFVLDIVQEKDVQILVLGSLGGRFDHELGNINVLYHFRDVKIVLLNDDNVIFLLPTGFNHRLEVPRGCHCGLVPVGCPSLRTTTTGLRWNLNETGMSFGSLISTSNITDDEVVTVTSDVDLLWTIENKNDYGNTSGKILAPQQ